MHTKTIIVYTFVYNCCIHIDFTAFIFQVISWTGSVSYYLCIVCMMLIIIVMVNRTTSPRLLLLLLLLLLLIFARPQHKATLYSQFCMKTDLRRHRICTDNGLRMAKRGIKFQIFSPKTFVVAQPWTPVNFDGQGIIKSIKKKKKIIIHDNEYISL